MIYIILAVVVVVLIVIMLLIPLELIIQISNNNIKIKLILFGIIKIRLNDKNRKRSTKEKLRKKTHDRRVIINFLRDIIPETRMITSKVHMSTELNLRLGMDSADNTAKIYGLINVLLYNFDIVLSHFFKSYIGEYNVIPDFKNQSKYIQLTLHFEAKQIYILPRALKIFIKYKKYIKGGVLNVKSSN